MNCRFRLVVSVTLAVLLPVCWVNVRFRNWFTKPLYEIAASNNSKVASLEISRLPISNSCMGLARQALDDLLDAYTPEGIVWKHVRVAVGIGSGSADFVTKLKKHHHHVVAVAFENADEPSTLPHLVERSIPIIVQDVCQRVPMGDWTIDLLHAHRVMFTVPSCQPQAVLREWNRVVRPGGYISLASPVTTELVMAIERLRAEAALPWQVVLYKNMSLESFLHQRGICASYGNEGKRAHLLHHSTYYLEAIWKRQLTVAESHHHEASTHIDGRYKYPLDWPDRKNPKNVHLWNVFKKSQRTNPFLDFSKFDGCLTDPTCINNGDKKFLAMAKSWRVRWSTIRTVFEIGAAQGHMAAAMVQVAPTATHIAADHPMASTLTSYVAERGFFTLQYDVADPLPVPNGSIDLLISRYSAFFIPSNASEATLLEWDRAVRLNGYILVASPVSVHFVTAWERLKRSGALAWAPLSYRVRPRKSFGLASWARTENGTGQERARLVGNNGSNMDALWQKRGNGAW